MELRKVKIDEIIPYDKNPRKNDKAVKDVAQSIKECGYDNPIVVDENMVVLAGHTRLKALKKLGWTECEVMIASGLTEEQKKKYRIYDNKTSEFAEWDTWKLENEIMDLDFSAFDFSFDLPMEEDYGNTTEFVNKEFGEDSFSDESFDYECQECGFRFNKK